MYNKHFSHIYVEKEILENENTKNILDKFKNAQIVEIAHYKDIFNRTKQDWLVQKKSQKLILAKRKENFLYKADSNITPDFGHKNYFYNALVFNCIYDCHYCYLQGMYPSAHAVCFVNIDDYFKATSEKLIELNNIYLCISYDSDILAFESFLNYAKLWIEYTRKNPSLTIEIRTKSNNVNALKDLIPCNNVILAWTLSPEEITKEFEERTPSLSARIKAIKIAVDKGWKVRLCLDPLINTNDFNEVYSKFIVDLSNSLDLNLLNNIYIGCFRLNKTFLKRMQEKRKSKLFIPEWQNYELNSEIYSYKSEVEVKMKDFVFNELIKVGVKEHLLSLI